ncbi:MAG: PH domain-containing protein [Oscillospiraceae bacterium]
MDLTFKVIFQKQWTLLNDKIIYGDKSFYFKDMETVTLFRAASFLLNGVIKVYIKKKWVYLSYSYTSRKKAEKALAYLQDNCLNKGRNKGFNKGLTSIKKEIKSLDSVSTIGVKKEVLELCNILLEKEKIKALTSCFTKKDTWLIACTDTRVIILDKGLIYGVKLVNIPLSKINNIYYSKGLILGHISITDGAVTSKMKNIPNKTIKFFVDVVIEEMKKDKIEKISNI